MFETAYKNINNTLRKDAGCTTALDYVEQTSWLLFLKYLDDKEKEEEEMAQLGGDRYKPILEEKFRWSNWAAPKNEAGKIDREKSKRGDDLITFIDQKLFPYLAELKHQNIEVNSLEHKISEIFGSIKNKISSGNNLMDIIEQIDKLSLNTSQEKHDLSVLYEGGLAQMGNAGRNGGEYYTPRPIIKVMVQAIDPQIGETVYDGAVGSAGFLVEAYEYMKKQANSSRDMDILKNDTLFGQEKKGLSFINAIMNMILHGIDNPNIKRTNSLNENVMEYQSKDKVNIVLANPPFGGSEASEVRNNFEIQNSGETAYLFLQHFVKKLKPGGRAAIIIKNTFLSNQDAVRHREWLLGECKIETILILPDKSFTHAGVKTVILFLRKEKSNAEDQIWYYSPEIERKLGKTSPIQEGDLLGFLQFYKDKKKGANAWAIKVKKLNTNTWDLAIDNPNTLKQDILREPADIIKDLQQNYQTINNSLKKLSDLAN